MILAVYDPQLRPVGLIEQYESCSWVRRFRSKGECNLTVPYSDDALEILKDEYLIFQQNGIEAMCIMTVTLTKDQTGADVINVTAYSLLHWLAWRVTQKKYEERELTSQQIIENLITANVTSPSDSKRVIPYVVLNRRAKYADLEGTEFSQPAYRPVYDLVQEQMEASKLGCIVTSDIAHRQHVFDFKMPENHTAGSASPVIFSVDYGTLSEQEFLHSHENYSNTAYVIGGDIESDEASYKKVALQIVGDEHSGFERREIGIEASDIKKDFEREDGESVTLKPAQVESRLIKRGEDELRNNYPEESTFTGSVVETDSLVYKQDWDLGDRVTCTYQRWGIQADLTISEIEEEYTRAGRTLKVTFGEGTPDFKRSLCALVRRTV